MKKTLLSLFVFFLQMFGVQPIWGQTTVAVEWTDAVGVWVSGSTITKTAATDVWDSGAASNLIFSGDGGVRFQANETNTHRMCGLSSVNADASDQTIAYALYPASNGTILVYESGILKVSNGGTYQTGDLFSVERSGTTVSYKKNGTTFYTSTTPSTGPLLADSSILTGGGTIANAYLVGLTNAPARLLSPKANSVLIDAPVTFSWDSGVGVTEYRLEVGSSAGGNNLHNQNYGTSRSSSPVIVPLTGSPIYVRLSSLIGGTWQYVDSILETANNPVDVVWADLVGVSVSGNTLTKTAATGWANSGAVSTLSFSADGGAALRANEINTDRICGLSSSNPDANYTTIAYGLYLQGNAILQVYENGTLKVSNGGTYQAGDLLSVERKGTAITYKKNGNTFYTSSTPSSGLLWVDAALYTIGGKISDVHLVGVANEPAQLLSPKSEISLMDSPVTFSWNRGVGASEYRLEVGSSVGGNDLHNQNYGTALSSSAVSIPLTGSPAYVRLSSLVGGTWQFRDYVFNTTAQLDIVWTDLVGVSVTGNTITKTAATGWANSGAASTLSFSKDGGVAFQANGTNTYQMCGLSPWNTDADYKTIAYAIYLAGGTLQVYENNVLKLSNGGTYQVGDLLSVERAGNTVTYKKNGNAFYTSLTTSSGLLLADAALYSNGGSIADAQFIGVVNDPAHLLSPNSNNTTLISSPVTFSWNRGFGVSEYRLEVGTTLGGNTLHNQNYGTALSSSAVSVPLSASPVYVRLSSLIGASWQSRDYVFEATTPTDVIWTSLVGVSASGNTITKTSGTAGWNSGAASSQSFTADGGVIFQANETNTHRICGLSSSNPNVNYTSIAYGLYPSNNGTVLVYENGTFRGNFGSYLATDQFCVQRKGNKVYYKKNGTVFYTSTVTSTSSLLVDSSIYSTGGTISQAKIFSVNTPANLITPAVGFLIASPSVAFQWTSGSSVSEYRLTIGNTLGAGDVYDQSQGTNTTVTVNNIPLNGQPLYVRLSSNVAGTWRFYDYEFSRKAVVPINFGASVSVTTTAVNSLDRYSFTANSGDLLFIPYTKTSGSASYSPYVELFDAGNNLVAAASVSPFTPTLAATGTYYLQITDQGQNATGGYALSIQRRNNPGQPVSFPFGNTIDATTTNMTEIDVYQFSAEAADNIVVEFAKTGGISSAQTVVTLYNQAGTQLQQTTTSPLTATLSANGTYYLWVHETGYDTTLSYRLTFIENLISNVTHDRVFLNRSLSQTSSINFSLQRPSNVTMTLYKVTPGDPSGTFVDILQNNMPMAKGSHSLVWNGNNSSGQSLPSGVYAYTISAEASGRSGEYDPEYTWGTVSMSGAVIEAATFDPYQGQSAVLKYNLLTPAWVTLKIGMSSGQSPRKTMMTSQPRDVLNNADAWDGRDDSGYLVSAGTYYAAGWTNILPDNSIVLTPSPLAVTSLVANPYAFFPAYNETAEIKYEVSQSAVVSVRILDPGGTTLIRNLITNESQSAGTHIITWDGLDNNGRVADTAGNYVIQVTATDPAAPGGAVTVNRKGNSSIFR
jgi:flagellar hook assembly protein FlgD